MTRRTGLLFFWDTVYSEDVLQIMSLLCTACIMPQNQKACCTCLCITQLRVVSAFDHPERTGRWLAV